MSENPENANKTKSETVRFHGFPAQINLSPGSETHRRFGEYGYKAGATSNKQIIEMLLDACENPHVDTDNSEVIENLQLQLSEAKENIESAATLRQNYENEFS